MDIKIKLNKTMLEKFGKLRITDSAKGNISKANWGEDFRRSVGAKISKAHIEMWHNKSYEEKCNRAKILAEGRCKINKYDSKVEMRVAEVIESMGIKIKPQFFIGHRSYDIKLHNSRIVIEIQGDYWHANPMKYTAHDILSEGKLASEIWEKDALKKKYAEKYGYIVVQIWENDVRYKNDTELYDMLKNIIESYGRKIYEIGCNKKDCEYIKTV